MPALEAQTKILGCFARKQPMTSLFSNSRWANAPGCSPLRSPGLARRPPKTDKFGNFPILEKTHIMTGKLAFFIIHYCQIRFLWVNVKEVCHKLITVWQYSSVTQQKSQNYRKRPVTEIKSQTNWKKPGKSQTFSWKILRPDTFRKSLIRGVWP